jgi:hypothetical protein
MIFNSVAGGFREQCGKATPGRESQRRGREMVEMMEKNFPCLY